MTDARARLERECEIFTRFLVGTAPNPYVSSQYARAHDVNPSFGESSRFDERLLRLVVRFPSLTASADAFARIFAPRCVFRRKLVLMFAILESTDPFYRTLEDVTPTSPAAALLGMTIRGCVWLVALAVGTLVFLPLKVLGTGAPARVACDES
jgi:hypothetical protein